MAKKNNRRSQLTERFIRDALLELLQDRPSTQITIKDICETADLNRTTFYLHYNNLNVLLQEVEQNAYAEIKNYIRSIRSGEDKIDQIKLFLNYIKDNLPLFRVLLLSPEGDYKERFMRHFLEMLNEEKMRNMRIESGIYAQSFIVNGCVGLVTTWIEDDFHMPSSTLAELLYDLCRGAAQAV